MFEQVIEFITIARRVKARSPVEMNHVYRQDQQGDGGGIAFLIRNTLTYSKIDCLVNESDYVELSGVNIHNLRDPLSIIACYRSPSHGNLTLDE